MNPHASMSAKRDDQNTVFIFLVWYHNLRPVHLYIALSLFPSEVPTRRYVMYLSIDNSLASSSTLLELIGLASCWIVLHSYYRWSLQSVVLWLRVIASSHWSQSPPLTSRILSQQDQSHEASPRSHRSCFDLAFAYGRSCFRSWQ
jgi:hypothetical protein